MRLLVAVGSIIALVVAVAGLPGTGGPPAADAVSSGTLAVLPMPHTSAWDGDHTSVNITAQDIITTTMCLTDPNDANSPQAPCGLGAFGFSVSWDPLLADYVSMNPSTFLGSTGRTISCFTPTVGTGTVHFQCVSLGAAPLGPQGTGPLATLTLAPHPPATGVSMLLTISNINVTDITGQQFPASGSDGRIDFGVCADVTEPPDNSVDLGDTVIILTHFGEFPPSDAKYDPNGDNGVDLSDAIFTLEEFNQVCIAP